MKLQKIGFIGLGLIGGRIGLGIDLRVGRSLVFVLQSIQNIKEGLARKYASREKRKRTRQDKEPKKCAARDAV